MKKISLLFYCFCFLFACEKVEVTGNCSFENPLEDLAWLQQIVQDSEASSSPIARFAYLQQATLNQQTVFLYSNSCPNCNTVISVYNCAGEKICSVNNNECSTDDFSNQVTIWQQGN